jgi:short-subunit dehydrogenase
MENSAALVTGASKGIGKEIARQLAAADLGLYTSRSGVLAWKGAVR